MTILWTASNIILHVSSGSLGLVLNREDLEFKWLYRILLVVHGLCRLHHCAVWKGMFNEHAGAVNAVLAVFGVGAVDWFGTT